MPAFKLMGLDTTWIIHHHTFQVKVTRLTIIKAVALKKDFLWFFLMKNCLSKHTKGERSFNMLSAHKKFPSIPVLNKENIFNLLRLIVFNFSDKNREKKVRQFSPELKKLEFKKTIWTMNFFFFSSLGSKLFHNRRLKQQRLRSVHERS